MKNTQKGYTDFKLALAFICILISSLNAQNKDRIISKLRAENLALKKQLAILKLENERLKSKLCEFRDVGRKKFRSTIKKIYVPNPREIRLPNRVKLDVVHISQQNDNRTCATTSVAMAISYYKKETLDKEKVWKISGTNVDIIRLWGNDMAGLKRIADHYGYKNEYAAFLTFHDLEFLLSKGILPVINIKYQKTGMATHAVLVTGYDRSKRIFYINDPATSSASSKLDYVDLKSRWSAYLSSPRGMSIRSAFIIYPTGLSKGQ